MSEGAHLDRISGLAVVLDCQRASAAGLERVLAGRAADDRAAVHASHELQQSILSIAGGMIDAGYEPCAVFDLIASSALLLVGTGLRALHRGGVPCDACFEEAANKLLKGLGATTGIEAEITTDAPDVGPSAPATQH